MEASLLSKSPKTYYSPEFLPLNDANNLFNFLNKLEDWKKNEYNGTKLKRETIVFASDEIADNPDRFKIPGIWGKEVVVLKFPKELSLILEKLEHATGAKYNIALGNRYPTAKSMINFHSDNEEFGNTQSIASISLGVTRSFTFMSKKRNEDKVTLNLQHGSLLYMGENCQENYTHGMKKEKIEEDEIFGKTRINVTFRVWNYEKF